MQNPGDVRTPARAPAWAERGLAAALTLCFTVALVLKLNESPGDSRSVQFVLLGLAVVLALALVGVRRRGARTDVPQNGHMSR